MSVTLGKAYTVIWCLQKVFFQTLEIGPEHRNNAVRWLVQLTRKFHFLPETFALSVTILDRFLQSVKVSTLTTLNLVFVWIVIK